MNFFHLIIINLLNDLVVEFLVILNKEGLYSVKSGDYPKGLAAILRTQALIQDLVVEAILKKSIKIAYQALFADPVINNASQAKKILESMLKLQKNYI